MDVLERALSLWRGAPLADFAFETVAQNEVAGLEEMRVSALEQLIQAKLRLGRQAEVIVQLEALIAEHPYREALRVKLMLALYRCGRQADALQAYKDAHRQFDELGLELGEELHRLQQQILKQDPALAAPAPPSGAAGDAAFEGPVRADLRVSPPGCAGKWSGALVITASTSSLSVHGVLWQMARRPGPVDRKLKNCIHFGPMAIQRADHRRSTERAHLRLRDLILDGDLAPGDPISQVEMARRLGTSRTPLREAVRLLQQEGLLEGVANQRVRVSGLDLDDLEALAAMRVALEPLAVRITVPTLGEDDLAGLQQALDGLDASVAELDLDGATVHHRSFHLSLCAAAPERLRRTVADLWDHGERYRRAFAIEGDAVARFTRTRVEHVEILHAASEGDAAGAAVLTARHLGRTALTVLSEREPERDPAALRAALREATSTDPDLRAIGA